MYETRHQEQQKSSYSYTPPSASSICSDDVLPTRRRLQDVDLRSSPTQMVCYMTLFIIIIIVIVVVVSIIIIIVIITTTIINTTAIVIIRNMCFSTS